jgi:hypothetical protein
MSHAQHLLKYQQTKILWAFTKHLTMDTPATPSDFSPPGNLTDLNIKNQQIWSRLVSSWTDDKISFFSGTRTAYKVNQKSEAITWSAFPNQVCFVDSCYL